MKKALLILASVAMASTVAMADVESQNMVGFSKATVPSNSFWMVACNFQTTDGSNEVSIQDLFPAEEVFADPGNIPEKCDQIMVFNGSSYKIYVYNQLFDEMEEVYYGTPVWKDGTVAATNMFKRGDGFWYKRSPISPVTTLTVKGQAPVDSSVLHDAIPVGFMMIGNAYPNSSSLTNLPIVAYSDPGNIPEKCDQIMVFNGSSYKIYVYNQLFDEMEEVYYGSPVWKDGTEPASSGLLVGQAAWYKRSADAPGAAPAWSETKPY